MKPETLRDVLESQGPLGKVLVRRGGGLDYFTDLLHAPVYRSCPECGGSRVLATGPPLNIGEPCPACADAPVAIVEAALRDSTVSDMVPGLARVLRETRAGFDVESAEELAPLLVDAVLSTVLGRPVRYARTMHRGQYYLHGDYGIRTCADSPYPHGTPERDAAILEEAGKEE